MTRVVENSPGRLRLYSRPSVLLLVVLWCAFVACLIWVAPSHRLEVRRTGPHAAEVRVQERLFGLPLSRRVIREVTGAEMQRNPKARRTSPRERAGVTLTLDDTARVVFLTTGGEVPMTRSYNDGSAIMARAVEVLNDFLAAERPDRLVIPIRNSLLTTVVGWFLGFVAIGATVGAWCECTLDRGQDLVRIRWANLPRARVVDYRLSDVEKFLVIEREAERRGRRRGSGTLYGLGMRLRSGEEVSLTRQFSSWIPGGAEELAAQLERFRAGRSWVEQRETA